MVFHLEPVTDIDLIELTKQPDGDNLVGTPLAGLCWPDTLPNASARRVKYYMSRQQNRLATDPSCRWMKCVDISETGHREIVAMARWHYYPGIYDPAADGPKDRDGLKPRGTGDEGFEEGEVNWGLFDYIVQTVDNRIDWVPKDGPVWCKSSEFSRILTDRWTHQLTFELVLLGMTTRPSWRRKGAASMLVEWGVQQAKKTNAYAGLEASADGRPVYAKYGFQQVGPLIELDCSQFGVAGIFEMANMVVPRPSSST